MDYRRVEQEVCSWLNKARTNPRSLIPDMKELLTRFQGNSLIDLENNTSIETNEGPEAVYEALAYLKTLESLPSLRISKGLTQAARDHCYDIGPSGGASHTGTDGSSMADRIQKYGRWNRAISENISFTETSGKNIVLQFIIDDGNESRSHRKNIFNPDYAVVGVGCGYHSQFELICVVDLAGGYDDHLEMLQTGKPIKETIKATPQKISHMESPPTAKYSYKQPTYNPKINKENLVPIFDHGRIVGYEVSPQKAKKNTKMQSVNSPYRSSSKKKHTPSRYVEESSSSDEMPRQQHKSFKPFQPDSDSEEDEDWLPDAVKCRERKHTKIVGNKKITTIKRVFTLRDGSKETIEDSYITRLS